MFRTKIIEKLSTNSDLLVINRSRCCRRRFNENKCSKCADSCPKNAISIEEGVDINREMCTECMLCIAECPTEAIAISTLSFYSVISKLRKVSIPVLGCNRDDIKAHVNTYCMGLLSEEHLISLMFFLNEPLQINLTDCKTCKNSFIVDVLKKRLDTLHATRYMLNKIILIKDKSALKYEDIPCDRRSFFSALKNLSMEGAQSLAQGAAEQKEGHAFGEKVLPFKRRMLNKALDATRYTLHADLIKNYFYDIYVDEGCDLCFACRGMCPTGALEEGKINEEDVLQRLFFNAYLCVGCGLCADFCERRAVKIKKGFIGDNPFVKKCVKEGKVNEEEQEITETDESQMTDEM